MTAVEDALGRVARTAYDPANRPVAASDPLGRTTHTAYDDLDRVTRVTGPSGKGVVLAYDDVGNLTDVTDPREVVIERRTYDAMNRVKTRTDANDRVWSYTYDANGNLATVTDPKLQVTRYVHDPLDRLVQVTDADGRVTRLTYDAAGRLARVEDSASGATVYQYDDLDRLTRELSDRGTIEYAYNDAGELTERTVNGGDPTAYAYDLAGRIKTITFRGRAVSYTYDGAGRLSRKTLPNGIAQVYAFDDADQLTSLSYRDAADAEIDRIDYGYDPAGQRVLKNHEQGLANQETPLVATYDDANRMVTFNGHTLAYDANGNLTRRDTAEGPVTYTWNARDELIAIAGPHGTASFAYDHLGRRIEKTVNGITTGYLYHGAQAIAELNGASLSATYHVGLAIDEVVARYTDEGSRSLLTDALGSVVALSDETGMVSTRYGYSPYGETADAGEENDNPLKYTGREDDGSGVYYYRARYYDPELKRFISVDPIGLAGGVNVYAYVGGNPLGAVDPTGLTAVDDVVGGVGSYFRGIYGTFRYAARRSGFMGKCEKGRAELEGQILLDILEELNHDPSIRAAAISAAKEYARRHPARVGARLATGAAVSLGLGRAGIGGSVLGVTFAIAAVNGNIRDAIERGAGANQFMEEIIGGAIPEDVISPNCKCP